MSNGSCAGRTKAGEPCGGFAVTGSDYCFSHAPERAQQRLEARRKGGKAHQPPTVAQVPESVSLRTVEDVQALLELVVTDTLAMPNGQARNRLLIAAAQAALTAVEKEVDLGAIRQLVERLEAGGWRQRDARQQAARPGDDERPEPPH